MNVESENKFVSVKTVSMLQNIRCMISKWNFKNYDQITVFLEVNLQIDYL